MMLINGKKKILLVEDEVEIMIGLARILKDFGGWPLKNIHTASNSIEACNKIQEEDPELVLLDLKIPRVAGDPVDIANAVDVLKEIELYNYKNNRSIKVIIISASIEDSGLQKLILGDRSDIVSFIDKNESAINTDDFKNKLFKRIEKALSQETEKKVFEYSALRRSKVKKLKDLKPEFWNKIEETIFVEYEKLNGKNANIHNKASMIITNCGKIIEDIICYLKNDSYELSSNSKSDDYNTIRSKLIALTGRRFLSKEEGYSYNVKNTLISRSAADCAMQAYRYRSEAAHSNEDDPRNEKIYKGKRFTIEDATISVDLIMPLVNEFTEYLISKKI